MSTAIAWTDETWNPVVGCTRVSPGCKNCYASALHNRRYKANVKAALEWNARSMPIDRRDAGLMMPCPEQYDEPFATVQLLHDRLERPLHWRKPRRVFVNSMSDLFHEDVDFRFLDCIFAVMAWMPQHTFQVLTKRPDRMRQYIAGSDPNGEGCRSWPVYAMTNHIQILESPWPLPNVWLGVSVEDQETADARIPLLLDTPAAVRWVSLEPQLGRVNMGPYVSPERCDHARQACEDIGCLGMTHLDWVVQGGESGGKARPFDVQWARDVRDQCTAAQVPYFCKQLGAKPCLTLGLGGTVTSFKVSLDIWVEPLILRSRAGADEAEWPEDLQRCRAWPKVPA